VTAWPLVEEDERPAAARLAVDPPRKKGDGPGDGKPCKWCDYKILCGLGELA
jgi:hypothetical protein